MNNLLTKLKENNINCKTVNNSLTVKLPNGNGYSVVIEKTFSNNFDSDKEFSLIMSIINELKN